MGQSSEQTSGEGTLLGNGIVGILSETTSIWERRAPLTPAHCARLLNRSKNSGRVTRIIVQPSTRRIHHDALYEDVGCEISEDLSECGLIVGVKQPKLEMILPDRAYAFFSHTHKAQKENMPLLDKILAERCTLYDYELIVGDHGKRLLAFGKFAGRAGMIDFLRGLGQRYLSLGYSTPFLSIGASYMYSSLAAAKAAVISVGEEISTFGLPMGICPLVFIFTGSGNVSEGAQEIFKLLPHKFVKPSGLQDIFKRDQMQLEATSKRVFQVYGCVVTCQDMVEHTDLGKTFDKADYYAHPEHYRPVFHENIAPYASVIVNCMYWEPRFPRLLSISQLQDLTRTGCRLVGISDISCDIGGSIEFVNKTTSIDSPFFRYDPVDSSYHDDMEGNGVICSAVDILPTEFAKEASQHFGDILSQFVDNLASIKDIGELPSHLRRACLVHCGALTSLFEYIPRMRSSVEASSPRSISNGNSNKKKYCILVSLSGHLFDQFLINEALDIIEAAGGSFHSAKCQVGQSTDTVSYSELEVGADDKDVLDKIIDDLTSLANPRELDGSIDQKINRVLLKVGKVQETETGTMTNGGKRKLSVLIIGAGRVCRPAAELLASAELDEHDIQTVVASLYIKDAEEIVEGLPNATAVQLDVANRERLNEHVSQADVVISLLPPICHLIIADSCIELKKHLVTASYVDDSMAKLDDKAKVSGITILGEMGLDPGIDHMMAMKMINDAKSRSGKIKSFTSYCGGLPSPAAANNPLAYKFSWSPAGAIRAGRNPATYKLNGETIHVKGEDLYDSAAKFRLPDLPAFALECLPNRDSLIYGNLYGIEPEASTIFRGTLRYEGFGEIMGTLARIGLFDSGAHPSLNVEKSPTYRTFLQQLLNVKSTSTNEDAMGEKELAERILSNGYCTKHEIAAKTAKTIIFLGLLEPTVIPSSCNSAFEVTCLRMEERLAYSSNEQDMVLLHHELEVEFPDDQPQEKHTGTLIEFGKTEKGKTTTAMALTVGVPVAIGALLLLENKIEKRGVLRPIEPEVYEPALDLLQAHGIKIQEKIEKC
ncbi:unnamed protein product [Rhodiola kirilowii]